MNIYNYYVADIATILEYRLKGDRVYVTYKNTRKSVVHKHTDLFGNTKYRDLKTGNILKIDKFHCRNGEEFINLLDFYEAIDEYLDYDLLLLAKDAENEEKLVDLIDEQKERNRLKQIENCIDFQKRKKR